MLHLDWTHIDWATTAIGTLLGAAVSVPTGFYVNTRWEKMQEAAVAKDRRIRITSIANDETLRDPTTIAGLRCFRIDGHLGALPEGHEIWLLSQNPDNDLTWPHGFHKVAHQQDNRSWSGYIYAKDGNCQLRIIAVVAPPTSQMLFDYYQEHGNQTWWAGLKGVPPECTNSATVLVRVP